MGQAKARGTRDQRVAEAVERARLAAIDRKAKADVARKLQDKLQDKRVESLNKGNVVLGGRSSMRVRGRMATSLVALAAMSMLAR